MRYPRPWSRLVLSSLLPLALFQTGCGGGGGDDAPPSFTVGGTVSGLTASGLVLANGNTTVAVAANATSFTLPTAVAFGSDFNVTVQGKAQGQTCTVANGSSTMGAGNVTRVSVNCGAATFSVSTLAGADSAGSTDGSATVARFRSPRGVAVNSNSLVHVTDADNNKIRRISAADVVSTFAGSGVTGDTDGLTPAAAFNRPRSIAFDSSDNAYVTDQQNHKIRKITPAGVVSTLAGNGTNEPVVDGTGAAANFDSPQGVAVDSAGHVYVAELSNRIRKITPAGVVTTLAGSAVAGGTDGSATAAQFNNPQGLAVDSSGQVFVADTGNNKIRKIAQD